MRVVVIGATGNIGTATVRALAADSEVTSIIGVARRRPELELPKTEWAAADIREGDLGPLLLGAAAVIHLAWLFQPTHDPVLTWEANVVGSARVFAAVAQTRVPALVYASSVGAYSPGPKDRRIDEGWPTHGWPTAAYGREKAYVERLLDGFEHEHPTCRVVRLRPGFVFQREAAPEQRRLFAGPLVPRRLVRPGLIPVVPDIPELLFQVLHAADAGEAFRLAAVRDVRGPFNLAAEPVVDTNVLADLFEARKVRVPARGVRAALAAAWTLGLVPASPQLFDLALRLPLMDTGRARRELGWQPAHSSQDALREFLEGLRSNRGMATPPLARDSGGRLRVRELISRAGHRP